MRMNTTTQSPLPAGKSFLVATSVESKQPRDGGFYRDAEVEAFIRKFGYADKNDKPDRMNFGGRHVVGVRCPPTGLTMQLAGFDIATGKITDANGAIALLSDAGEVAASWSFKKILEHWSHKHSKAVYVPSKRRTEPTWQ